MKTKILAFLFSLFMIGMFQFSVAQTAASLEAASKIKEQQKDYQYAIVLIDKAIAINDTNIWYYIEKSELELNANRISEVMPCLWKAMLLKPKEAESYNRAGTFYSSIGNADSALYMMNKALSLATADSIKASYYLNRGTVKAGIMDFAGALEDDLLCLKIKPDDISAMNNAATSYRALGNTAKAIEFMNKTIRLDSTLVGPYNNLAFLYTGLDSLDKAMYYMNKAIALSPDEGLVYNNRGHLYYKMKQYSLALQDVNKSIGLYPGNSYAYRNRALIYLALNKTGEACADLDAALSLGFAQRYGPEVAELKNKNCK